MRLFLYSTILATLCMLLSVSIFAQNTKNKNGIASSIISSEPSPYSAKIVPGVVVVKLKPEFRELANNINALYRNPKLIDQLKKYRIKKFTKMFPTAKKPETEFNSKNERCIDVSLIHTIEFEANVPVAEVIEKLLETGVLEYAEPQYEEGLLYIPNDTLSQPDTLGGVLLDRINAYKAWDIEKGNSSIVIGVLDTGTELTHPDLINSISYNTADPINGMDDDGDGYVDNYYGWDVGSNDNNPTWQGHPHGVNAQGVCSSTPDNTAGIAGTGFNCKAMPVKIANSSGSIVAGYQGIIYAADHGAKVINLSWGGFSGFSQANQDIINYAAINKDVLLVGSAGNTNADLDFYPASYKNVISVAGLDPVYSPVYDTTVEIRTIFSFNPTIGSTYSINVDMSSLMGGWTTNSGGTWIPWAGTSFAAPSVAGAAGLVRARYPALSALQAAQMLRVNGDILDTFDVTRPDSRYKLGRKLNMYKALTNPTTPAVRINSFTTSGKFGANIFNGDTVTLNCSFFNFLSKTNNLNVRLVQIGNFVTMVDSLSNLGSIDSLSSKSTTADNFKFVINSNAGPGQIIELVLLMTDPSKNYYDYEGFRISVNPSFVKLDTNNVKSTITSIGRFGFNSYETSPPSQGLGVKYLNNDLLYEGGLMIGNSPTRVSDCVRGNWGTVDREFKSIKQVKYVTSSLKDMETRSVYNDSLALTIMGLEIEQRSYAWKNAADANYFIMEYQVHNRSSVTMDSIYVGLFADWDIANYQYNRADWNDETKLAYTYSVEGGTKVAGIALLTDNSPSCYSVDHSNVGGNNINPNDGFTRAEKYATLSRGVARKQAGMSGFGNDVSQIVGARINNFAPGDTETVAFAIIGADNIFQAIDVAAQARAKFVSIKQGSVPSASGTTICSNDTINFTITPANGKKFAFYNTPPPSTPISIGTSYTLNNISQADTIYVTNRDSLFDSQPQAVYIRKDNMALAYFPSIDTITINEGGNVLVVNQSNNIGSIIWDFGDGATATGNSANHIYSTAGYYKLDLIGTSPLSCIDTLSRIVRVAAATATADMLNGVAIQVYPNPVSSKLTLEYPEGNSLTDLSIELTNALGHTLTQLTGASSQNFIDMSNYSPGIYYIVLRSGGKEARKKIIKN